MNPQPPTARARPTSSSIAVGWIAVPGAQRYKLRWRDVAEPGKKWKIKVKTAEEADGGASQGAGTSSCCHTIRKLNPGTCYAIDVLAGSATTWGRPSAALSISTASTTAPAPASVPAPSKATLPIPPEAPASGLPPVHVSVSSSVDMCYEACKCFVHNIPPCATDATLIAWLDERLGSGDDDDDNGSTVVELVRPLHPHKRCSKGCEGNGGANERKRARKNFAFVTFADEKYVEAALRLSANATASADGEEGNFFLGRPLHIMRCDVRPEALGLGRGRKRKRAAHLQARGGDGDAGKSAPDKIVAGEAKAAAAIAGVDSRAVLLAQAKQVRESASNEDAWMSMHTTSQRANAKKQANVKTKAQTKTKAKAKAKMKMKVKMKLKAVDPAMTSAQSRWKASDKPASIHPTGFEATTEVMARRAAKFAASAAVTSTARRPPARTAWAGGAIVSNKAEALRKFLQRAESQDGKAQKKAAKSKKVKTRRPLCPRSLKLAIAASGDQARVKHDDA